MSAAQTPGPALRKLAELALPMPWEKPEDVPFSCKHDFRAAITPAAYMELVDQRDELVAALRKFQQAGFGDETDFHLQGEARHAAADAIARATASEQQPAIAIPPEAASIGAVLDGESLEQADLT